MRIPLFPLHNVLFPSALLPLRVFEHRYRAMLSDVLSGDRSMGIVAIRRGAEVGGPAEPYDVGCLATIEQVTRAPDGTGSLVVRGTRRFRIAALGAADPYPTADVELMPDATGDTATARSAAARAAVHRYLGTLARLRGEEIAAPPLLDDPIELSYALAAAMLLDLAEHQRLLEAHDAATRLDLVRSIAAREATLLERVGLPAVRPANAFSPN